MVIVQSFFIADCTVTELSGNLKHVTETQVHSPDCRWFLPLKEHSLQLIALEYFW